MIQETQDAAQSQQPFDRAEHTLKARDELAEQEAGSYHHTGQARISCRHSSSGRNQGRSGRRQWRRGHVHASRRGRGGAALGRAVHAVLQTIDLETGKGIKATARAQAAAEGIPQSHSEVADLARNSG